MYKQNHPIFKSTYNRSRREYIAVMSCIISAVIISYLGCLLIEAAF